MYMSFIRVPKNQRVPYSEWTIETISLQKCSTNNYKLSCIMSSSCEHWKSIILHHKIFFVSQQINSAFAVHLTPIKGQKKGTLMKNQINFCSDTCMYDGKRNSIEWTTYLFLWFVELNIEYNFGKNNKGDIHWKFE